MFLIAGVSPKTKILDNNPRLCPVCGLARAYFKRVDHYFNLFFIPILRVKVHEFKEEYGHRQDRQDIQCNNCGKDLYQDFKYCPYCGKHIS